MGSVSGDVGCVNYYYFYLFIFLIRGCCGLHFDFVCVCVCVCVCRGRGREGKVEAGCVRMHMCISIQAGVLVF